MNAPTRETASETDAGLDFLRACVAALADSIVRRLRSTTDPLTADLVEIRGETADMVSLARIHDRAMSTGEDLERIDALGGRVREDMVSLARLTQESHQVVEGHFAALARRLETVLALCGQIEEVSAKINVLSINASIEAARAGAAGRGFKVIATEVKNLAQSTSELLTQILDNVRSTKDVFGAVGQDLGEKKTGVSRLLAQQENSFDEFRSRFGEQRGQFETLYRGILSFAAFLDAKVLHLSPLVQLHDIVVQELENLALVNDDALRDLASGQPQTPRYRAAEARKRLTTKTELDILSAVSREAGVAETNVAPPVAAIELF
jgi:methyl-accepting chemotaxis protein